MKVNGIRQNSMALLAALIWGTAFVAQSMGAEHVEAFTYNAARSLVGFLALLVLCAILRRRQKNAPAAAEKRGPAYRKTLLLGGLCCGTAMTVAANLQQKGLETTTAGKAGFITALYIVIVPIIGLFLKKRVSPTVWVGVALAVVGLYLLCIQEDLTISQGDFYILLCAFCYSAQILLIDHFAQRVDGVELSCVQLFVVTVFSAVGMAALETPAWSDIRLALGSILYVGIFSSAVAYTLQILAQKDSNPTVISLLLSLESVFATLSGALILHDRMSGREYLGCALMLAAVVLAQLPAKERKASVSQAADKI
jgi:drug/metabolite transporter (DMT)-like permease